LSTSTDGLRAEGHAGHRTWNVEGAVADAER
jgi:hypothetical protein